MKIHETVGTPDYICPEILRAHEGETFVDITCDFWSLGRQIIFNRQGYVFMKLYLMKSHFTLKH